MISHVDYFFIWSQDEPCLIYSDGRGPPSLTLGRTCRPSSTAWTDGRMLRYIRPANAGYVFSVSSLLTASFGRAILPATDVRFCNNRPHNCGF